MSASLTSMIERIQDDAKVYRNGDEQQRLQLLQSARALVREIETPPERLMHLMMSEPLTVMVLRVLVDLGALGILAKAPKPMSATQLAKETNADPKLMERLLKHLSAESFIRETGPDTYTANDLTKSVASPGGQGAVVDLFDNIQVVHDMPEYLKQTNYQNPTDKDKTGWKYSFKTDQHYFEWVTSPGREDRLEALRQHMSYKTIGLKWYEVPDLMEEVFGGASNATDDVLLVDVGGSGGHDLIGFQKSHSSMPGRLILQDLPATIESLDSIGLAKLGIEAQGHDFFTPEPIIGAKAYYSKMCLHDWPDVQCKQILSQLKPALKPGYSRILLNEIVIPETKAGWFETSLDLLMMNVHASHERRETQWRQMIEDVDGLKVKKIWDVDGALEKLIEIELA